MRILITGVNGNIGKPLSDYLKQQGHTVFGIDLHPGFSNSYAMCDINDHGELSEVFREFKPDVCIALAALYGRLANEKFYHNAIKTNIVGLANTIALCKQYAVRIIFTSSSEIYGQIEGEMTEDREDLEPNNRYGMLKLMGEWLIMYEVNNHGLDAITLRMNMIISPNEQEGVFRSAMIRFCEALHKGQPIEVYQGSTRSWLAISDAVKIIEKSMDLPSGTIMNVAHDEQVAIEDIAEYLVEYIAASPDQIIYKGLPSRMTLQKPISTKKMKRLTGIVPEKDWKQICREVADNVKQRLNK